MESLWNGKDVAVPLQEFDVLLVEHPTLDEGRWMLVDIVNGLHHIEFSTTIRFG